MDTKEFTALGHGLVKFKQVPQVGLPLSYLPLYVYKPHSRKSMGVKREEPGHP
mgnify:CR=1 FL=1|jgi:hypothetical protein